MSNEVKVRFSSDGEEVTFFEVGSVTFDYIDKCTTLKHKNEVVTCIPTNKYDYIEIGNDVTSSDMCIR